MVSLGTPREAQKLEGLYPEDSRRYMHHYNFPPFSTGETWFLRGPKRREIGHGALAERALLPMIPSETRVSLTRFVSYPKYYHPTAAPARPVFVPPVWRLLDCGVPIKKPVAGVAMGLISDGEKFAVLD